MVFPGVVITHKLKVVCQVKGEGSEDARSPLKPGTENFKKPNLYSRAIQSMTERRRGGQRTGSLPAPGGGCRAGLVL